MKFLPFVFKNLFRNKRRTLLTVTSIAVSLFLVATLLTVLSELENPPTAPDSALRLISRHKVSLANILPVSYREKIAKIEDVRGVVGAIWFQGVYLDPANIFAQMAVNSDQFFTVMSDLQMGEQEKQAYVKDQTGAIAGKKLADRFGWKVGQKIILKKGLWPMEAELTLRGIYRAQDESALYFHWEYFDEGMKAAMGPDQSFAGFYWIKASSVDAVPKVAERVDALFRNTTAPTKTESEKAFVLGFVSMMGNIQLLIKGICSVVIFAVVLVAANTMAMSIRERSREIGVLKAIGFSRVKILLMLLGESVLVTLIGALVGSFGARLLFSNLDMYAMTAGFMQRFLVTRETLTVCISIGLFMGFVASVVPALQASRRPVVEALRRVV